MQVIENIKLKEKLYIEKLDNELISVIYKENKNNSQTKRPLSNSIKRNLCHLKVYNILMSNKELNVDYLEKNKNNIFSLIPELQDEDGFEQKNLDKDYIKKCMNLIRPRINFHRGNSRNGMRGPGMEYHTQCIGRTQRIPIPARNRHGDSFAGSRHSELAISIFSPRMPMWAPFLASVVSGWASSQFLSGP